jgi:ankyrin repeat protein
MTRPPLLCYRTAIKPGFGVKFVKRLRFIVAATALAAIGTPIAAQQLTAPSYDFVTAVKNRNGDKATQLLNDNPAGIVNSRDGAGDTGLILAIARQDSDWTAFLINKGADPNLGGKGGDTPLITAARVGFEDAVEWLVNGGAKVDGTNKMGETALIVAVQQRQVAIVRVLLGAGANPDKADTAAGYSAREYAERDTRSRQILQLIEAKKPKASAAK